jgi:hypothetical protein
VAPKTIRKQLIEKTVAAQTALDRLDQYLFAMVQLANQRSDPITEIAPVLANGHQTLREVWAALRAQL